MLLSNKGGKSEGDHIILHSLKINYSCSSYLSGTILCMSLFCLLLGNGTMWQVECCNPALLSPMLMLRQLWFSPRMLTQASFLLCPMLLHVCPCSHGPRHKWVLRRMETTDCSFYRWLFYEAHTSSQPGALRTPCYNSSSAASHTSFWTQKSKHFGFMCLFVGLQRAQGWFCF